jgi:hypothetical protein
MINHILHVESVNTSYKISLIEALEMDACHDFNDQIAVMERSDAELEVFKFCVFMFFLALLVLHIVAFKLERDQILANEVKEPLLVERPQIINNV